MLNTIDKIRSIIDVDLRKLKSMESAIKKIQSLIDKGDYIPALKISQDKLRNPLTEAYPDSIISLDELESKMKDQIRTIKLNFDKQLICSCEKAGLVPVSGDYRKGFRIKGIIEVIINFDNGNTTVSTYSRKTITNSIKQKDIIQQIEKCNKRLFGRKWDANKFIKDLYAAYSVVSKGNLDKEVLLRDVQTQLWLRSQSEAFWKSFDKERMNDYPTDEFSADLSRLLGSKNQISHDSDYFLSEGAGGITVYDNSGNIRSFKFLTFRKKGEAS